MVCCARCWRMKGRVVRGRVEDVPVISVEGVESLSQSVAMATI